MRCPPSTDQRKKRPRGRRILLSRLAPLALLAAGRAAAQEIAQPRNPGPEAFMKRTRKMKALALATGDRDYGAVVVQDGRIIAQAPSRVVTGGDPVGPRRDGDDPRRRAPSQDPRPHRRRPHRPACRMCETAAHWPNIAALVHGPALTEVGRPRYRRCQGLSLSGYGRGAGRFGGAAAAAGACGGRRVR